MIVTLLGSSGLVGAYCTKELLKTSFVTSLILPVRTLPEVPETDARVKYQVVDFDRLQDTPEVFKADAVICCLGTTLKKAKSKKNREKVDLRIPLSAAAVAKANKVPHFIAVSAMGASPHSWMHYNRTKGHLESGLEMLAFPSLTILRPSLILGERKEKRFGEDLLKKLFERAPHAVPAFWRPVHAESLARAITASLENPPVGKRTLYNRLLIYF
ncbi:MAG: NAD(P)H-binding protein [Fibrobacter sp.]|jgi:uncharacterized protein YbjT (DUF2867 family)|nr:NAD(P)H-binding protein [Fibrobacter sp.]